MDGAGKFESSFSINELRRLRSDTTLPVFAEISASPVVFSAVAFVDRGEISGCAEPVPELPFEPRGEFSFSRRSMSGYSSARLLFAHVLSLLKRLHCRRASPFDG
jgi:hypothetical protein